MHNVYLTGKLKNYFKKKPNNLMLTIVVWSMNLLTRLIWTHLILGYLIGLIVKSLNDELKIEKCCAKTSQ